MDREPLRRLFLERPLDLPLDLRATPVFLEGFLDFLERLFLERLPDLPLDLRATLYLGLLDLREGPLDLDLWPTLFLEGLLLRPLDLLRREELEDV